MPIFKVQDVWSGFSSRRSLLPRAIAVGAAIMGGPILFQEEEFKVSSGIGSEEVILAAATANRLPNRLVGDTTRPSVIEAKPCSVHATYRNREEMGPPYRPARQEVIPSLHEFTCRWAVGNDLSILPNRLPKYVRSIGDSLRLTDEVLAYGVNMTEYGQPTPLNALYLVVEMGDSLFYHEVDKHYHNSDSEQSWEIRALRPLDVSGAVSQYIWFEYSSITDATRNGDRYVSKSWTGHIYTYDSERGVRFLQWAPIRSSVHKNGRLEGAKQWDVSVPEAGVMLIEPRLHKGKDLTLEPPEHWIGTHVIDSSATDVEPRPSRY